MRMSTILWQKANLNQRPLPCCPQPQLNIKSCHELHLFPCWCWTLAVNRYWFPVFWQGEIHHSYLWRKWCIVDCPVQIPCLRSSFKNMDYVLELYAKGFLGGKPGSPPPPPPPKKMAHHSKLSPTVQVFNVPFRTHTHSHTHTHTHTHTYKCMQQINSPTQCPGLTEWKESNHHSYQSPSIPGTDCMPRGHQGDIRHSKMWQHHSDLYSMGAHPHLGSSILPCAMSVMRGYLTLRLSSSSCPHSSSLSRLASSGVASASRTAAFSSLATCTGSHHSQLLFCSSDLKKRKVLFFLSSGHILTTTLISKHQTQSEVNVTKWTHFVSLNLISSLQSHNNVINYLKNHKPNSCLWLFCVIKKDVLHFLRFKGDAQCFRKSTFTLSRPSNCLPCTHTKITFFFKRTILWILSGYMWNLCQVQTVKLFLIYYKKEFNQQWCAVCLL